MLLKSVWIGVVSHFIPSLLRFTTVGRRTVYFNYIFIRIKIHAMLVHTAFCPFFNPLPMEQFYSQVYLWVSLKKTETTRPL